MTYAHAFHLGPQEPRDPSPRALAALAGAAALTITGMSPASAAHWSHDDAVGDVQSQTDTFNEDTGEEEPGRADRRTRQHRHRRHPCGREPPRHNASC